MSTTSGRSTTTAASASTVWSTMLSNPFGVTWRSALVKAPRLVPMQVLKYTCPEGPYPLYYTLKSRDLEGKGRTIPVYIWVPPPIAKVKRKDKKKGVKGGMPEQEVESSPTAPYPVVIDFHGGSFVLGSCLEQGPFCAQLCRELGAVVISVDYRMGPVDKFPAAIEDGEDVLRAVMEPESEAGRGLRDVITKRVLEDQKQHKQLRKEKIEKGERPPGPSRSTTASSIASLKGGDILDPSRISISGFSSGGNIAHNLCLDIKPPDLPEPWPSVFPPDYQTNIPLLLFFPSFDARILPSQRPRAAGVPTPGSLMTYVDDILAPIYLPRHQAAHPRASPGLPDVKQSLHPTTKVLLLLPELDSLAEQSETWITKVKEAGRQEDLEVRRYPRMKHGWTQFPTSWLNEQEKISRKDAIDRAVSFVREAWRK